MELIIDEIKIPFRETFQHASAARSMTEAILVKAVSSNGSCGFGEGCPRHYVTGESTESARIFFNRYVDQLEKLNSLGALQSWVSDHQQEIDNNPAAFCAIELALLNAFAAETSASVEQLLCLPPLDGDFQYTAVIGSDEPNKIANRLAQYIDLGFADFKVKLCGQSAIDAEIISILKSQESELQVRFDANNLWSDAQVAIDYLGKFNYPIFALEEPLQKKDFAGCRKIHEALGCRIILDESFLSESDFEAITGDLPFWIINLRVSKMGGCLRSLAVGDKANKLGIPLVIGAQVGETSILTRAALTVANTFKEIVIAREGAFGTHLLEYDLCDPPLMFGRGGILSADQAYAYELNVDHLSG